MFLVIPLARFQYDGETDNELRLFVQFALRRSTGFVALRMYTRVAFTVFKEGRPGRSTTKWKSSGTHEGLSGVRT